MLRRVVVLGGTGYVGRRVCAALAVLGVPALSVSRSAPSSADKVPKQL
jgi:uncharacterized protein YbjT (DUF2867 family)